MIGEWRGDLSLPGTCDSSFKYRLSGVDIMAAAKGSSKFVPDGKDPTDDGLVSILKHDIAHHRSYTVIYPKAGFIPGI